MKILEAGNDEQSAVQRSTLAGRLQRWARQKPDQLVFTFLADGEVEARKLTYGELDLKARSIAAHLQGLGMEGERALLLYPPGLDFITAFLGCMYAGVVAVPAYPPRRRRPDPRLVAIARDCRPALVLTDKTVLKRAGASMMPVLEGLPWIPTDELSTELAATWRRTRLGAETPTFLQYTSGSTGTPKGVIVTGANLVHNEEMIGRAFRQSADSVVVGWLPLYHDMGLIGNVLQPLYQGARCVLMSPTAFLHKPVRWLKAISHYRASTSGGPNFAYDLCVRRTSPEDRRDLDLSSWTVAYNGSEPVRTETLERFAGTFAASGFRREAFFPCYGLAESTLFVTGGSAEAAPMERRFDVEALERNEVQLAGESGRALVSCGEAWLGQEVAIVDPKSREPCAAGRVGEIWVHGPSAAGGYWGREASTEETFRARLAGEVPDKPYLRTGDLGFLLDGELFVTGRTKDLIIVRGRNLYPHDLELTAERAHPSLRHGCGAAFAVEEADEEHVVLVLEVEPRARLEVEEIAEAVRRAVAEEHEVQVRAVVLTAAGAVPKTSSGKIRRRACRQALLSGALETLGSSRLADTSLGIDAGGEEEVVFTRDELLALPAADRRRLVTSYLHREARRTLGSAAVRLEDDRPLTALGLDSLRAMELAARLEDDLGVTPGMASLLEGATLGDLADEVLAGLATGLEEGRVSAVGETSGEHPLSHGQEALWFLHCLAPESAAYNVAAAARLAGPLDTAALRRSFERLAERHPALRTRFPDARGDAVQEVLPDAAGCFELLEEDASGWDEARLRQRLAAAARRPFDLRRGPLLRILVLRVAPEESVLLLAVHHIVTDFWSLAVLLDELDRIYPSEAHAGQTRVALEPLALRYSDFVRWQKKRLESPRGELLESYWRERLGGELPVLDLPLDRPRPPVPGRRGAACHARLPPELAGGLRALASAAGATLNMALHAAFQALLHRYTGQREVLVGTPSSGRTRPELAGLVGYFVNPLVIRGDLGGDPPFATLLARFRRVVVEAFRHQDYPFELLVRRLHPEREASRSPVFQVMFSMLQRPPEGLLGAPGLGSQLETFALGRPGGRLALGGLRWTSIELEEQAAPFDLTLAAAVLGDGVGISLQYSLDLFEATTARRMSRHFAELLASAVRDSERPLSALSILTSAERLQLLEWNATGALYPRELCLHDLVEAQARRTPHAVAVGVSADAAAGEAHLTYGGLDGDAERLAGRLRSFGVGPETPVAVAVERSPAMIVALLATLKAGGAYVPLDATYPQERLAFMLEDAFRGHAVRVLLTGQAERARLPSREGLAIRTVVVDAAPPPADPAPRPVGSPRARPENLAYAIYTSGSTGRPKGVQIPHRTVVNFLESMRRAPGLEREDVFMAVTTLSFDIAVLEIFLPLMVGARVVLASREVASDGRRLGAEIERHRVSAMQATPATWRLLLEAGWPGEAGLVMLCGGEALPETVASGLLGRGAALWNMYGPTETTIWSAAREIAAPEDPVRVGGAIGNTCLHVLGRRLEPLPAGVAGEILIGGEGLARGYLGRPALTAERFLPDPFAAAGGAFGGRLYQVGDRVRRLGDGTLEFLGRVDHQVKLRGYRIELGEIEAALRSHPALCQVVAAVRGGDRLAAWVVTRGGAAPPAGELRDFLRRRLPEYMIPADFVTLDTLPLTPNGKIDRAALVERDLPGAPPAGAGRMPRTRLEETLAELWCEVLGIDSVGIDDNFFDLGGHSLLVARLHRRLGERLERDDLTVVDLFQHPTVGSQARFLAPEEAPAARRRPASAWIRGSGEVAIIGMAGRFPGAADVEAFWSNLERGVESITFFADDELIGVDPAALRDPEYVKARGVLEGVEELDAAFFGYTPREAEVMDPQHRLFLECAWEALEAAGYDSARYPGRIGLFASAGMMSYLLHVGVDNLARAAGSYQAFISNDKDFVPTRTSYKLGLRGPSVNVQTACSSSLVAVHLACQSLALGESEMALAGGVAVRVPQEEGYRYEAGGILSPDGHCRPFDAEAGGTTLGNGLGVVVLKPLERALADGDSVLAVIKGSAMNNDGALKMGYTAPSVEGQAEAVSAALAAAGVSAETLGYVEAHGTGTELGDPIEVRALVEAFRANGGGAAGTCALGSVKSNIGHLDTAAGVAGLIKTVLALGRRRIPPSVNFTRPNPRIPFAGSPFYVNRELAEWPSNGAPRRAGVSSFGIGGTNVHVVLEEAPAAPATSTARAHQLLLLSAKTPAALDAMTSRLAEHLGSTAAELADVAHTLQVGRRPFEHRRWLVARGREDAAAALAGLDPERVRTGSAVHGAGTAAGAPVALRGAGSRVVFLLSGQGSQYPGMGRRLYETEPVFRAEVDRCAAALADDLGLDLRRVLYPGTDQEGAEEALRETRLAQPALFVTELALARLWAAWGVAPAAMLGHSIGELTAAALAGVFTVDDALGLVAARGRLMQERPPGAMLAVGMSEAAVAPLLGPELALAAVNGPQDVVVSGPAAAVDALAAELTRGDAGVRCRRLHTSHAFHSAMMRPAADAFFREVAKLRLAAPRIPFVSNVTGDWISDAEATDPHYWGRHLAEPVRFAAGLAALAREPGTFLEVGPGHALATLARPQARGHAVVASLPHPAERENEESVVLAALGRLWQAGVEIDWESSYSRREERRRRIFLPTYPFERRRFWIDGGKTARPAAADRDGLDKKTDVGAWFHVPVWKQSFLADAAATAESEETWLLLAAADGLGALLAERLESLRGLRLVTVTPGHGFARPGRGVFEVDPGRREDLTRVLEALERPPDHVVYAWTADAPPELLSAEAGFAGLLALVQALAGLGGEAPVRLSVLTRRAQKVAASDRVEPAGATLWGLVKVVPQEVPRLACRAIDLAGASDAADLLDELVAELAAPVTGGEVAYRGGERWVRVFEPLRLPAPAAPRPLTGKGAYLVTGGLGGVGLTLARALVESTDRRAAGGPPGLVLLGRRALPPRAEWGAWLEEHGNHDTVSRKIRGVLELETTGAEVMVAAADVADREALERVVAAAGERFGGLCGVVHAAGVAGGGILGLRRLEDAAAVLHPKVGGVRALWQAVSAEPLELFLLCSSINAVVGGFGQGDYCAANAFLDAFAWSVASRRGPRVVSLGWDRFRGLGMAAATGAVHSLLGTAWSAALARQVYRAVFSPETHWVLAEHRIAGRPTVPGATYLEMARAAFAARAGGRPVEISGVVFLAPLAVDPGAEREVLTVFEAAGGGVTDDDEAADFRVLSRAGEEGWQEHCRGRVKVAGEAPRTALDVTDVAARCPGRISPDDAAVRASREFLATERRWQGLEGVRVGDGELLASIVLADDLAADLGELELHPALLDVAVGCVQLIREGDFLPLAYERLTIHGPLPRKLWSHLKLRGGTAGDTLSCDAALVDETGVPRVTVEGFSMRQVSAAALAELARARAAESPPGAALAGREARPEEAVLEGTIEPGEAAEVLRRVLSARRVPPHLVISPRDLEAVREAYRGFDPARLGADLEGLEAPVSAHSRPDLGTAYVAPGEGLEKVIAETWRRFLGIEEIGAHDNFFELGGTSLLGVQVVGELKRKLGREIPTVSLFEAPTVAALARHLEPPAGAEPAFAKTRSRADKKKAALTRARQARGGRAGRKR